MLTSVGGTYHNKVQSDGMIFHNPYLRHGSKYAIEPRRLL